MDPRQSYYNTWLARSELPKESLFRTRWWPLAFERAGNGLRSRNFLHWSQPGFPSLTAALPDATVSVKTLQVAEPSPGSGIVTHYRAERVVAR
ncbi:uncharacterized protein PGTG_21569 [Puccinia graminis f. sp. tritici CRL 75-36-700-3]|uniref:Uncharacterized protein n=1 Tax=Puccinia graminis f. sp. tritici (strain CRL 75-36-700-3 / race SCCL) TaxID=418459 RepID=H6QS02_PUCGT|nr:uncharacterized protein PGTG_21569 [Puccinia graminis f. sp. tritici CRL 75-36-700-3]EHS63437.1 hypothetical protein PGTG_21569 [Puccinia graminis f. sp. tritici CRL 75-36-700-3]